MTTNPNFVSEYFKRAKSKHSETTKYYKHIHEEMLKKDHCSVEEGNQISVNFTLIESVEVLPVIMEVLSQLGANKAPVPRFENVIHICFRI